MMRSLLSTVAAIGTMAMLTQPVSAQSMAGPYLAARSAVMHNDFEQAASYFTQALARDRANPALMESVVVSQLALGRLQQAIPVAQAMQTGGHSSQIAQMVLTADAILNAEFDKLAQQNQDLQAIGALVDGLIQSWAQMGRGEVNLAIASFDQVAAEQGLSPFALFHKAMALASVGDFEGAEAIFANPEGGPIIQTRRGILARVEILSQLDQNDTALELLTNSFSGATDPELVLIFNALQAGETLPFTHVTSVQDGFAEVFFSLAAALSADAEPQYTLLYAQIALNLRPDHVDAILLAADLLETLEQYEAAIEVYKRVPADDPAYHAAELGRAAAMRMAERPGAAIEVLEQLTRSHGEMSIVHSSLGDALRQQERYEEAVVAYDTALSLSEKGARGEWFILYARGICYERLGEWETSEADFRAALEINPGQPQVLNYLGYSLVEHQIKLDEALEMIERAVEASPNSGYIIDSLGWALYRLGRYEEAVPHMERAVELMAVDPIVNDHLGDVYWAVGRYREAEFQWMRALSFLGHSLSDQEVDPDRIRRKIEVGLDVVLEDEGADPLRVATD